MIFLKNLRTNPTIRKSVQNLLISTNTSSSTPTLSSLFAKSPSRPPQIAEKPSPALSSLFKPIKNKKSPPKNEKGKSPNRGLAERPSENGELQKKDNKKKVVRVEEKEFRPAEISAEGKMLVRRILEGGYLKEANFWKGEAEEAMEVEEIPGNSYARRFLTMAATEKLGRDHQEIAKWLNGSDLKKVALFGCPSFERKSVFAAKRLRAFFRIQEEVVCRGCKLKTSCRFINKKVGTVDKVMLEDVMRLIAAYTLDSVHPQLVIPGELQSSIGEVVKDALRLTS